MSKKEWFGLRGTDIAMVYQDALSLSLIHISDAARHGVHVCLDF